MIGYDFFPAMGTYWRRHHGALVPLVMPHAVLPLSFRKALRILVQHQALFVRWEESFDQVNETEWWHVIKDVSEELEGLSKKTRNQVRRGLKLFSVNIVDRETIISEGYAIYCAAFDRYETFEKIYSVSGFYHAVETLPEETEFWVVRERESGRMVAFSENLVRDNACFYNTIWFEPEALKAYAGYALFHEMNKHYLNERGLRYVSDGARSISHQTSVHDFLEQKFGFRRAYARLRVVYFPGLGLAVRFLYPFRKWFAGRSSGLLQKIAVLLEQERIRRACASAEERM